MVEKDGLKKKEEKNFLRDMRVRGKLKEDRESLEV